MIIRASNSIKYNPNFGTNIRSYFIGPNKDEVYTQTQINRPDLDFKEAARLFLDDFKDCKSVKIYNMACSDGSEAFTLAIHLNEMNPKEANKFLPIIATDIDPIILSYAKSNKLNMVSDDLKSWKECNIDYRKYFSLINASTMFIPRDRININSKTYEISDFLKNSVHFEKKTIKQQVEEIDENEPKIICCRNVLPYLGDDDEMFNQVYAIYKKMRKGDYLLLGDFDRSFTLVNELKSLGVKEIQHNVFKKTK